MYNNNVTTRSNVYIIIFTRGKKKKQFRFSMMYRSIGGLSIYYNNIVVAFVPVCPGTCMLGNDRSSTGTPAEN